MDKKREEKLKKRDKRVVYDSVGIGVETLTAFIVFGIIALSLALVCGYFMGNYGEGANEKRNCIPVSAETVYSI